MKAKTKRVDKGAMPSAFVVLPLLMWQCESELQKWRWNGKKSIKKLEVEAERERMKGSLFFQMHLLPTSFCHFLKQLAHITMA